MTIGEANDIISRYPTGNINTLYQLFLDPNVNKSHWTENLWDICNAVNTCLAFQNKEDGSYAPPKQNQGR